MMITREQAMTAIDTISRTIKSIGLEEAAFNRITAYVSQLEEALREIRTSSNDHYARQKSADALEGEKK